MEQNPLEGAESPVETGEPKSEAEVAAETEEALAQLADETKECVGLARSIKWESVAPESLDSIQLEFKNIQDQLDTGGSIGMLLGAVLVAIGSMMANSGTEQTSLELGTNMADAGLATAAVVGAVWAIGSVKNAISRRVRYNNR